MLIAGRLQPFEALAMSQPDARPGLDFTDDGQGKSEALERALRAQHPGLRCGADQLEVLGVRHRERPLLWSQAPRERQTLDVDSCPEALRTLLLIVIRVPRAAEDR